MSDDRLVSLEWGVCAIADLEPYNMGAIAPIETAFKLCVKLR
ncbi:hypothetical protein CKA32_003570 [Geitlerinema sp. FC II]|nr:hypothetical protein CKA32_003570 [Geitlerinema sp. FC II]